MQGQRLSGFKRAASKSALPDDAGEGSGLDGRMGRNYDRDRNARFIGAHHFHVGAARVDVDKAVRFQNGAHLGA